MRGKHIKLSNVAFRNKKDEKKQEKQELLTKQIGT